MSEASEAKRDGARLQKNSGRGKYSKGDAIWYFFVVDYKEYTKSYSISREDWAKVSMDALSQGYDKQPLIKVILEDGDKMRLGVIEWSMLEELVEFYIEHGGAES